ncbi:MAG: sensor histidine kinase [Lachnospiraceae bacterium]|nr:sensor histidine kinase [Lachnospiraceae bacterium]
MGLCNFRLFRRKVVRQRFISIKTAVMTIVSLSILFSVLIVSTLNYYRYVRDYFAKSIANEQELVEQIVLNVDTYIDELSRLCLTPYYDSDVMSELEKTVGNTQELLHKKRVIEDYLRQIMIMPRKDIISVFVCSDAVYSSTRQRYKGAVGSDYKESEWFNKAFESDDYIYSSMVAGDESSENVFSFSKSIKSINNNSKTLGVIRVDANFRGINDVCNRVAVDKDGALFILDADSNRIYENSKLDEDIDLRTLKDVIVTGGAGEVKINGRDYIVISEKIDPIGWYAVKLNSKRQLASGAVKAIRNNGIFAILLIAAGVLISINAIKKYLTPLYRTIDTMQEAKEGNLDVRAKEESTYEIKVLNETFNQMISQIGEMFESEKEMTKRIYETELLQKEAKMESLYHQIQPHFLFNTLNTISILIKSNRKEDAVQAIEELSVLMRGVTNSNQDLSIADELHITESYLKLQKLRHDSLEYEIICEDDCRSFKIPALSIQPLAENAFVHGFENVSGEKKIRIKVTEGEEHILVTVEDNGAGMNVVQLKEITDGLEMKESPGAGLGRRIGLLNIHRRIQLKYGSDYGIRIDSTRGQGTTVKLILPRIN